MGLFISIERLQAMNTIIVMVMLYRSMADVSVTIIDPTLGTMENCLTQKSILEAHLATDPNIKSYGIMCTEKELPKDKGTT